MSAGDAVPQGRLQLGVLAWLTTRATASFTGLVTALETSNGALSVQLRRLEDLGWVRLERGFLGRKPRTVVVLTPPGRAAYERWLDDVARRAAS